MARFPCKASDTVPLWECPCDECTRLDWEASDTTLTLTTWRRMAREDLGYVATPNGWTPR